MVFNATFNNTSYIVSMISTIYKNIHKYSREQESNMQLQCTTEQLSSKQKQQVM